MTSSESAVEVQLTAIDPLPVSSLLMSYLSSIFIGDGLNMKRSEEVVVRTYIGYVEIFCHAKCYHAKCYHAKCCTFLEHNILHGVEA